MTRVLPPSGDEDDVGSAWRLLTTSFLLDMMSSSCLSSSSSSDLDQHHSCSMSHIVTEPEVYLVELELEPPLGAPASILTVERALIVSFFTVSF